MLVFALVALAASVASAVVRLRPPVDLRSVTPVASAAPLPSPRSRAAPPLESRPLRLPPPRTTGAAPVRIVSPKATPAPPPAAPRAGAGAQSTVFPPAATPGAAPAVAAPVVPDPAGPAAVTSVSPPVLRRGATALVDVHGVGLRRDHQVRIGRGGEAVRGVETVRQRYVGPSLLQVLLRIDPSAATGGYVLFLVDAAGSATNPRPLQIGR
jgi:hypothetical protein